MLDQSEMERLTEIVKELTEETQTGAVAKDGIQAITQLLNGGKHSSKLALNKNVYISLVDSAGKLMEKSLEMEATKGISASDYSHFNELYTAISHGASRATANMLPNTRLNAYSDAI